MKAPQWARILILEEFAVPYFGTPALQAKLWRGSLMPAYRRGLQGGIVAFFCFITYYFVMDMAVFFYQAQHTNG